MAEPMKKVCATCSGTGRVPRELRRIGDGEIDPLDFQREQLCSGCGGSGKVIDPGPDAEQKARPGTAIADCFLSDDLAW